MTSDSLCEMEESEENIFYIQVAGWRRRTDKHGGRACTVLCGKPCAVDNGSYLIRSHLFSRFSRLTSQ
jgi:hypothetical protein